MSHPLVTIVIPTIGRLSYLRRALGSALEQTYPALQIVVSDNGSADGTAEYLASISDPRLEKRRNESTVNPYAHTDQWITMVRGEYCMVLCDDDSISDNYVACLMQAMLEDPSIAASCGRPDRWSAMS